jgi:Sulfotransferase family
MSMQETEKNNAVKYVFVCGLQRSGTSVLARNIGRFGNCTAFRNTGVLQDEGQYLQDVYATDHACGGTGRFGFNPRAHLTETSDLLTPENVARLKASWERYWDPAKSIRIEKTPKNLIMTRFLQAAFPDSYFVVIKRHPVAVSMANQRWKVSMRPLHQGFQHWLKCYGLFEADKEHLRHLYELDYEDYIADPARYHREIADFIGTDFAENSMEQVADVHNRKYLDRWRRFLDESPLRGYYRYIARKYEPHFEPYGYSLTKIPGTHTQMPGESERGPALVGELYCRVANIHAFGWRLSTRSAGLTRRVLRKLLPAPVKRRIKNRFGDKEAERVKRSLT